jgi:hypothetical protein
LLEIKVYVPLAAAWWLGINVLVMSEEEITMRLPTLSAGARRIPRERRGHDGAAIRSMRGAGVTTANWLQRRGRDCFFNCLSECDDPYYACFHNCNCDCYGIPGKTCQYM